VEGPAGNTCPAVVADILVDSILVVVDRSLLVGIVDVVIRFRSSRLLCRWDCYCCNMVGPGRRRSGLVAVVVDRKVVGLMVRRICLTFCWWFSRSERSR